MHPVPDDHFDQLIEQALESIPQEFRQKLRNIALFVEEELPGHPHVLGRYEGVALPERTAPWTGYPPDTIAIYKRALERHCANETELVEQVAITVIHEIGHYFGIDDARLHELGWG